MIPHAMPDATPTLLNQAAPWGWRDLIHATLLAIVGFIVLCLALVIALVIQRLMSVSTDLLVLANGLTIGIYAIFLLAIYWTTIRRYHLSWVTLGVRAVPSKWLFLAPVIVIGMFIVDAIITAAIGAIQGEPFVNPQVQDITQGQQLTPLHLVLLLISIAVVAPIVEELFFRGMLYPLLLRQMPTWLAVIANAAIFAGLHFIPILLPVLFVMGLVLAIVRIRTNSVLPSMFIHGLNNGIFVLAIYSTFRQTS